MAVPIPVLEPAAPFVFMLVTDMGLEGRGVPAYVICVCWELVGVADVKGTGAGKREDDAVCCHDEEGSGWDNEGCSSEAESVRGRLAGEGLSLPLVCESAEGGRDLSI